MKKLLLILLLTISPVSMAGEPPLGTGSLREITKDCSCLFCLCKKCDCKKNDSNKSPKKLEKLKCGCSPKVEKPRVSYPKRVWVEDVYQHGLWYYGYYHQVAEGYEFRFSHREYKGSLSNFRSLYSVYYKEELRTSVRQPVRTVYEPY